jgi:hypothetical protein
MILFVGDIDDLPKQKAKDYHPSAFLVDSSNVYRVMKNDVTGLVVYTSFADLPKITETRNVFFELLDLASEIYYVPPQKWSDHKEEFDHWSAQRSTEYLLNEINRKKHNVHGLELSGWLDNQYISLEDQRRGEAPQLWIAGCSISHGVGVDDHEKFGSLIAEKLGMPASFLTLPGSSITWAADQILRSDLKAGDILVWGLTSEYRFCVWEEARLPPASNKASLWGTRGLHHFNAYSFRTSQTHEIGNNLENLMYRAVISIHQVINLCQKINVRTVLLPIIPSEQLRLLFHDCPNWYEPAYQVGFVDIGNDMIHPGSRQHSLWADFCHDIIIKSKI